MNYQIELLTKEKVKDLVPMYENAFGKKITEAALQQKLDTNFVGISHVGYTAYDQNGNAVAFYGVFPCLANYNGETYLVAQSGNTMTHTAHQGKGLFTILAKKTYEYCVEKGIHLVFGFPNNNSYPGFVQKLNWIHFDTIEAYTLRVKTLSFYRMHKWFNWSENKFYKRGHRILSNCKKGQSFPSSCKQEGVPVIDHSSDFFNYKTYEKNYLIEVAGLNCWVKFNSEYLLVGDIQLAEEREWNKTLDHLKKLAAKMFIPHLRFQGSTNTPLANYFQKIGQKLEATHAIGGINFSNIIPLEKMKFTAADNDTF
ncbi:MAG: GNAT family N-acetyltransferase [Bacteroidota bacterium]